MNRELPPRRAIAVFLLTLVPVSALSAENAPAAAVRPAFSYFSEDLAPGAAGRAANSTEIAVDLALLSEDPAQLAVELPDGRHFLAVRQASWTEEGGRRYWSGGLHPDGVIAEEPAGRLALSAEGAIVAGSLNVAGRSFEIVPLAEGRQQLLAPAARATDGGTLAAGEHCSTGSFPDAQLELETEPDPNGKYPPSVVDVLAIFPRSLGTSPLQTQQTKARIAAWFADANLALANSGIFHRYRAVYSGALVDDQPTLATGPDQISPVLAYEWLVNGGAGRAEVNTLRDSYGADLVALFVPPDRSMNCGRADYENPTTNQYAVIDLGCSSAELLVAHELGHTLGMRHALDETPGPSPYVNAYGYDNDNLLRIGGHRAATVMACNGDGGGGPNGGDPNQTRDGNQCNRIPYFSNPTIKVDNVFIGNAAANNAEVARKQMYLTSLRRSAPAENQAPKVDILRPQGFNAQSQQTLTLSAAAWDLEEGNLEYKVSWESNLRGFLGTGSTLPVYTSWNGLETFTATIRDLGNLTASRSITLNFQPTVTTTGAIWHDPQFPGRFLSFNQAGNGSWVATWMAYEGSDPVWYLSPAVPVSANGAFSSQLYRITRNPGTGHQTATLFADLSISVETNKQIRLLIDPQVGPNLEKWLEPYTSATGPGGYVPLNTGNPLDGGWTIWSGPTTFGEQEAKFVITFDGSQPVWVAGLDTPPFLQNFILLMYRPTPATFTHYTMNPDGDSIGNLTTNSNSTGGSVTLNFPSGNSWIKPFQTLVPATVR